MMEFGTFSGNVELRSLIGDEDNVKDSLVMADIPGQVILAMNRSGYCIFVDTLCQGAVPHVKDSGPNDSERVCIFPTELEAQREIADFMITRIQQFLDGERDFEDAVAVEEYIVAVDVFPDGMIVDADGNAFGMDGGRVEGD